MPGVNPNDIEEGLFEEVESSCDALVPVGPAIYHAARFAIARPDANFVAHLIATAERLPQTRELRRAAPADALAAYRSFRESIRGMRPSTRQTV
jgi:hypothetical protein